MEPSPSISWNFPGTSKVTRDFLDILKKALKENISNIRGRAIDWEAKDLSEMLEEFKDNSVKIIPIDDTKKGL
jgi:hypothetical protein